MCVMLFIWGRRKSVSFPSDLRVGHLSYYFYKKLQCSNQTLDQSFN